MNPNVNADAHLGDELNRNGAGMEIAPENMVLGGIELQQYIQRMVQDQVNAQMVANANAVVPAAGNPTQAAAGGNPALAPALPGVFPTTSRFNWGNVAPTSDDMVSNHSDTSHNNSKYLSYIDLTLHTIPSNGRELNAAPLNPSSEANAELSNPAELLVQNRNKFATITPTTGRVKPQNGNGNSITNRQFSREVGRKTNLLTAGSPHSGTPNTKNGKRPRESPVQQPDNTTRNQIEGVGGLPPAKKKRLFLRTKGPINPSQSKITSFFTANTDAQKGLILNQSQTDLDKQNLSHLNELRDLSDSLSSEDISDGELEENSCQLSKREPWLFKEHNVTNNHWVLTEYNTLDRTKLGELAEATVKHNLKLFRSSISRAKEQIEKTHKENILKNCKGIETLKDDVSHCRNESSVINTNCHCSFQSETMALPAPAKPTWSQARNLAGDATRNSNRTDFYREALQQDVYEYWCMGLEKVPAHLMKIGDFRTELHATKIKHAKELMKLAIKHLELETKRCNEQSASMKATAVGIIQQLSPTDAEEIVTKSNTGLDITIANISANEYKDLERRRQKLQQSPPTFSDIVDPASNVSSNAAKPEKEKVFPRGGRGRGGSRPGRSRGGRKPYARGRPE